MLILTYFLFVFQIIYFFFTIFLKYFMFVVADSRRMVRSKKFFESEIPQSITRYQWSHQKSFKLEWSLVWKADRRWCWEEAIVPELPNRSSNHPATASVSVSSNFFQVCGLYGVWPNSHLKHYYWRKKILTKFLKMQPHQ